MGAISLGAGLLIESSPSRLPAPSVAAAPPRAPRPAPVVQPIARPAHGEDEVRIDVLDAPAGVQVTVDGLVDDLPIHVARGDAVHVLRFEAPGYEPRELKVNGKKDRTITLRMQRRRRTPVAAAVPVDPFAPAPAPEKLGGSPSPDSPRSNPF